MPSPKGLGMGAFFASGRDKVTNKEPPVKLPSVRTTIRLGKAEAGLLDLLRIRRRGERGRSVTYGDVVGEAIRRLAEREGIEDSGSRRDT